MRKWVVLAAVAMAAMATAGCKKPGAAQRDANESAVEVAAAADAYVLTPGMWEVTTVRVPPPGAPGQPETSTSMTAISAEDALDPARHVFGGCEGGNLQMSGGHVQGNMPCNGDGAASNASVSITGSYSRDHFQVTVDSRFMRMVVREERRGRFVRPFD